MGLDQYLKARRYMFSSDEKGKSEREKAKKVFPKIKAEPTTIIYEVGYWRKANHIHKWFVNNVQDGEDNCREHYVELKTLLELKQLCEEVLRVAKIKKSKIKNGYTFDSKGKKIYNYADGETITNKKDVAEILPTTDGFFFGSTDYDQWYISDIKETIKIIEKCEEIAKADEMVDFYYDSSW